jgi:hypothetical protein
MSDLQMTPVLEFGARMWCEQAGELKYGFPRVSWRLNMAVCQPVEEGICPVSYVSKGERSWRTRKGVYVWPYIDVGSPKPLRRRSISRRSDNDCDKVTES